MKKLIFVMVLSLPAFAGEFVLSSKALRNDDLSFISHVGARPWGSYLSYEIHYAPVEALRHQLEETTGVLKNRGEAHITVITPVEFHKVLADKLTIEEINDIALEANVQKAEYKPLCIGKGEAFWKGAMNQTYYVVVRSPALIEIRQRIHEAFVARKGDPDAFDPLHYFPHITLGYTEDDLHEDQGVIKNKDSCPEGFDILVD